MVGIGGCRTAVCSFSNYILMAKKGVSVTNILEFFKAWSTLKIPMLLFEFSNLGIKFTLIRMLFNIVANATLSWLVKRLMTERDLRAFQEATAKNDAMSA